MPKGYPLSSCKRCQTTVASRSELSRTGLCRTCGEEKQREVLLQISAHRGPWFTHWRQQMARAVGGVLLDDVRPAE